MSCNFAACLQRLLVRAWRATRAPRALAAPNLREHGAVLRIRTSCFPRSSPHSCASCAHRLHGTPSAVDEGARQRAAKERDMEDEIKNTFKRELEALATIRDELKLKAHLAKSDVKDE